jgi:molybdopterin-guanine dinucleotide biosynthesis protein A
VPAVAAGLALVADAEAVVLLAVDLPLLRPEHLEALLTELGGDAPVVAAADHRGEPNPLLAAYQAQTLRMAVDGLGPGDRAADLLGDNVLVVNLGEAATLNVNRPSELERARRLLRPAP